MVTALSNGKAKPKGPLGRVTLSPRQQVIVNADEVVINKIPVNFVEYEEGEPEQVGKRTIISRTPIQRTAYINDHVPAELYDTFMAMYDDFMEIHAARKRVQATTAEEDKGETPAEIDAELVKHLKGDELATFQNLQYQLVLAVWKITEEDMDLKRLRQGLDEEQLKGLFAHFFSRLSRQKESSAPPDENTSSVPEPGAGAV